MDMIRGPMGPVNPAIGSGDAVNASSIQAVNATFTTNLSISTPGIATIGLGTVAISSDNAVALLPSNSVRMVAVGTVLQFYFNQTGTAVLRAVVNLATF